MQWGARAFLNFQASFGAETQTQEQSGSSPQVLIFGDAP